MGTLNDNGAGAVPENHTHDAQRRGTGGDDTGSTWPPGPLLTVKEVAAGLGLSKKALYHRVSRGQIPGVVRLGRSLRFRRADLVTFIRERRGLSPEGNR